MALNYVEQTWVDEVEGEQEGTLVDAQHMSHIEEGVKKVSDKVDGLTAADVKGGTFPQKIVAPASTLNDYGVAHIINVKAVLTAQLPAVGSQSAEPNGTLILGYD